MGIKYKTEKNQKKNTPDSNKEKNVYKKKGGGNDPKHPTLNILKIHPAWMLKKNPSDKFPSPYIMSLQIVINVLILI